MPEGKFTPERESKEEPKVVILVDKRGGGVHFGKGQVRIEGKIVEGDQEEEDDHTTVFHEPVTGPVHVGSGKVRVGGEAVEKKKKRATHRTVFKGGIKGPVIIEGPADVYGDVVGGKVVEEREQRTPKVKVLDGPKGQIGGEKREDDVVEGEYRELGEENQVEQKVSMAEDQMGNQEFGTEEKVGKEKEKGIISAEDLAKLVPGGKAALPYLRQSNK